MFDVLRDYMSTSEEMQASARVLLCGAATFGCCNGLFVVNAFPQAKPLSQSAKPFTERRPGQSLVMTKH